VAVSGIGDNLGMTISYKGHRFPPEVISYSVWLYHRFTLSFRDVEDLLAERGVIVSYESIRYWCRKFGPAYARKLRKKQGRLGDIWHVDELFVTIRGQRFYLWRAVDQDGDVDDILVTKRRDRRAAERFFRRAFKRQGQVPWQLVTDKLRTYNAAHRRVSPSVMHRTGQYENNRAEVSHQPTRQQKVRCGNSSYSSELNGFSRSRASFKTCFESDVTTSRHFNIDSSDEERSGIGNRQRVPADEDATLATTMD
jgi:putative transposase